MRYTVDRFEEGWAVLESEQRTLICEPREALPPQTREGDVLCALPSRVWRDALRYTLEPQLTAERAERAEALRRDIPTLQDDGDIEL